MTVPKGHTIRQARPEDYDAIAAVLDAWWGREIVGSLPRLFLDHFHRTSLVAENGAGLSGFLIGFVSPSEPEEAYIHFVGVDPSARKSGLARTLYQRFFEIARRNDRRVVKAITSPVNLVSQDFHRRMGFAVSEPVPDYNGPGHPLVTFERAL